MHTSTAERPVARLSVGELESELLGLAGHIAAAECRFLRLLVEFDRRDGWAGPGLRSCAHWLSWKAGMSRRTAAEHLRVAHALDKLPRVTAAFAAGRISYSKVRAITRVTADIPDQQPDRPEEPDHAAGRLDDAGVDHPRPEPPGRPDGLDGLDGEAVTARPIPSPMPGVGTFVRVAPSSRRGRDGRRWHRWNRSC